jgi:hypothetical protein
MKTADPWRVPVVVAQIPDTGLHRAFEASEASRAAMAAIAGLRKVISANASFDLKLAGNGRVHVTGEVNARIGLTFAPPEQIRSLAALVDEAAQSEEEEVPDPPEPIVDGVIDLGRLATDVLFLAIDPYPRKGDAVFEAPAEIVDPAEHPFAALKALQTGGASPLTKKGPGAPGDGEDE